MRTVTINIPTLASVKKPIAIVFMAFALVLGLAACEGESANGAKAANEEQRANGRSYENLVAGQPAAQMNYSTTRETINFWINTWGKKGKLSYTYLYGVGSDGLVPLGYYVLQGLPVSMCASIAPATTFRDVPGDQTSARVKVEAPGMDGAYYGGAGDCNRYYGKDGTTGAYVEYKVPENMFMQTFDQPQSNISAPALAYTTEEKAKTEGSAQK